MDQIRPIAISFDNVGLAFRGQTILSNISLAISEGEFVCLLGPSGCGKSTTLRLIGDLLREFTGRITLDGKDPSAAWDTLAFVFQGPRLVQWRTALGNVMLGMELRGTAESKESQLQRASDALGLVGLSADVNKFPAMMSGGERQRVAIARAIAVNPKILLMDEPLASLDVQTRRTLRVYIQDVWKRTGKTIFFVTHDVEDALELATRIVVLSKKPTVVLADIRVRKPSIDEQGVAVDQIQLRENILNLLHGVEA